jgi:hypothetical protein
MTTTLTAPSKAPRRTRSLVCERWAAIRCFLSTTGPLGSRVAPSGREYIDLSTLSADFGDARALAVRRDEQNVRAIRRGEALPHARVVRVRIKEVR